MRAPTPAVVFDERVETQLGHLNKQVMELRTELDRKRVPGFWTIMFGVFWGIALFAAIGWVAIVLLWGMIIAALAAAAAAGGGAAGGGSRQSLQPIPHVSPQSQERPRPGTSSPAEPATSSTTPGNLPRK